MFKHLSSHFTVFTVLIVFSNSNNFWQSQILLAVSIALQDSLRRLRPADLSDDSEHLTCVRHVSGAAWFWACIQRRVSLTRDGRRTRRFLPRLCLASVTTQGATHPPKPSLLGLCNPACFMHHCTKASKTAKAIYLGVWEGLESIKCTIFQHFYFFLL